MYKNYTPSFDSVGVLGTLTGTCTVLLGYLVGNIINKSAILYEKDGASEDAPVGVTARIFVAAVASILLGLLLSIWVPVNKPLWSVSYVFYSAGWSAMALALLIYLIDVRGWDKPFFPFKAMGMNALSMYLLSCLLSKVIDVYTGWRPSLYFGINENMSLLYAFLYMVLHLIIAVILYRKKIFIKL